jgi:hypothetical protein
MAIDANNTVHLAYYDVNNGGLYYARVLSTTPTGSYARPDGTITTVKVDTYLAAGTKIMINVRNQNGNHIPYISYAHASFRETKNSVRVAWLRGTAVLPGSDDNDILTGNWEVMTVPVLNLPNTDEFICHGVTTGTAQWTTNGTGLTYTTNINRTIVVGYLTDQYYEGAILKSSLW